MKSILAVLALLLLVGCSDRHKEAKSPPYGGQVVKTSSPQSAWPVEYNARHNPGLDRELAERVQQTLASDNSLAALSRSIGINVADGLVTLTGTVPGQAERQAINEAIRKLDGVLGVYDQLQVQPAATGR